MAAIAGTITTADVVEALDVDLADNFRDQIHKLTEILGIFPPTVLPAGQALNQVIVTGELTSNDEYDEGDEVPLSNYKTERVSIGELEIQPFAKLTTAQAILQAGYENSVLRTDELMLNQVRNVILGDFFDLLANGTTFISGSDGGLQDTFAQIDATLAMELEEYNYATSRILYFVNPLDLADYLGNSQITTQTVYGMSYFQNFLGVDSILRSSKVPRGRVYATPVENIRIFGVDFASLRQAALDYTVSESGLIGVKHQGKFSRVGSVTNVLTGVKMVPEALNFIAYAELASAEDLTEGLTAATLTTANTVAEIRAVAAKEGIDLPSGNLSKKELLEYIANYLDERE